MRGKRGISVLLVILSLGFCCAPAEKGPSRFHSQISSPSPVMLSQSVSGAGRSSRGWWGVLYDHALLLARVDDEEEGSENNADEETETVEFVWPILGWLFALLSPSAAQ